MIESIQYARLAHRLIRQLCEVESSSTDDTPLELKQVALILESFDEVAQLVEARLLHEHKSASTPPSNGADSDDVGTIG